MEGSQTYSKLYNYNYYNGTPEVGIFKRKQERKKKRKHALDQENDQEKRKFLDKKYQDNVEKIQQRSTA